jgi:hypothetical protein
VYRREIEPTRDLLNFAVLVAFVADAVLRNPDASGSRC